MSPSSPLRRGHTQATEAREAVAQLHAQLAMPDLAAVVFFCSPRHNLDALADALNHHFAGVPVVGCTTAGEIGPQGYLEHSVSAMGFSASAFVVETGLLPSLQTFDMAAGQAFATALTERLEQRQGGPHTFGLLLIDGLSLREEPVAHALQEGLGTVPLLGGSAGDGLNFQQTWVFHQGRFHTDSAVLLLAATPLPLRLLRTQHFVADGERLVVTEVDEARRVVREINGLPAVAEYARLVGVPPEQLTPEHFASWPVVVLIDGTDYVRSIQHANPDGSLTFYCAIDEGVVLRVAHGQHLLQRTQTALDDVVHDLGGLEGMLVCDCILRNLEITGNGSKPAVAELFKQHKAVGFSTYGEQLGGVHINQTLTGIAFGPETG
jgi:hypothetical protein